jgi:RecA-family ATPase
MSAAKKLTALAEQQAPGVTYEAFRTAGWSDELLIAHKYLTDSANESRASSLTLKETQQALSAAQKALEDARRQPLEGPFVAAQAEYDRAFKAHSELQRAMEAEALAAMRVPPVDWNTLRGEPPARKWLIPEWLGISPTLMSGRGGAGKTGIIQGIATSLATGAYYIGEVAEPCSVVMWSCEDTLDDVWLQQHAINRHLQIEMSQLGRLHIVARYGHENTLLHLERGNPAFTPLLDRLREQVNDLKASVFIGDNIAQLFGGNENDRHHATMFVNGIAGLVKDRPFTPILLGHTAKDRQSEFSGNAAWENAVRMRLLVAKRLPEDKPDKDEEGAGDDPNVAILAKRKANHTTQDWMGFSYERGLWVPETVAARAFKSAAKTVDAEATVIAGLAQLTAAKIRATDAYNSAYYLPKQLAVKGLANGHTKRQLAEAMDKLQLLNRIVKGVVGVDSARHPVEGLKLAEGVAPPLPSAS